MKFLEKKNPLDKWALRIHLDIPRKAFTGEVVWGLESGDAFLLRPTSTVFAAGLEHPECIDCGEGRT